MLLPLHQASDHTGNFHCHFVQGAAGVDFDDFVVRFSFWT